MIYRQNPNLIEGAEAKTRVVKTYPLLYFDLCIESRAMYLRFSRQRKDSKEHRYWSVGESRRGPDGRVV
jgi:hypothetical protein